MVDMTKWELVKGMMESILTDNSIVDEDMGITMLGKQLSIPFRLSFNTLVKHKLIKISK
jgi:isopentenyl diphosphate isomerase/L-lactate dehydrogenase-like FMN-dependent dehydrogenase